MSKKDLKMICPHCNRIIDVVDRKTLPEPISPETYMNRLSSKRAALTGITKNLQEAREKIWPYYNNGVSQDSKGVFERGVFALLIAVESIEHYLQTDLNHTLKKEGMNPMTKR